MIFILMTSEFMRLYLFCVLAKLLLNVVLTIIIWFSGWTKKHQRAWKESWNKRAADMLGQSTIWFESTIRKHRENHFFLDQMFEERVRKGERLNQNFLISEGMALRIKAERKQNNRSLKEKFRNWRTKRWRKWNCIFSVDNKSIFIQIHLSSIQTVLNSLKFSKTFSLTNFSHIYFVSSYSVIQLNLLVKIFLMNYQIHDYPWEAKSKFWKWPH